MPGANLGTVHVTNRLPGANLGTVDVTESCGQQGREQVGNNSRNKSSWEFQEETKPATKRDERGDKEGGTRIHHLHRVHKIFVYKSFIYIFMTTTRNIMY